MDYDTFKSRFPSSKTLERCGLTKDAFVKQYIHIFNKRGPLAVGLADVGIAKLVDSGAIIEKAGKLVFVPEKADMESLYRQAIGSTFDSFLNLIVSIVHRMQDGLRPVAPITLAKDASISVGAEHLDMAAIESSIGIPRKVMHELVADICSILKDDPLVWARIGTFKAQGDTVVCVPYPESSVALLPPLDRPKYQRISRVDGGTDAKFVRSTRTE